MGSLVTYRAEKGVAVLTLNDPPHHPFTYEMLRDLDNAILEARFDNDVHVLLIHGGNGEFSHGASTPMLREADATFNYYFALFGAETLMRLEQTPKLTIAALSGDAVAAGFSLALACDLRVARAGGAVVGFTDTELGLVPMFGGAERLAKMVGTARAMEWVASGSRVPIEDAADIGIIQHIFQAETPEAFLEKSMDYAREFLPPDGAPLAVGRAKRALYGARLPGDLERELAMHLFPTADAREGLAAANQKRSPVFRGR